eukprot:TRINITY_DN68235_c0_g1_i1.p2 TRINITY_DN68235_c0_g1~~TRINITY_DN68235_c0_g1_i1.p2  ORF type:complete len:355 (+),score=39.32 TRINITY_DN68235_c0_g1_i1:40-1065(+)
MYGLPTNAGGGGRPYPVYFQQLPPEMAHHQPEYIRPLSNNNTGNPLVPGNRRWAPIDSGDQDYSDAYTHQKMQWEQQSMLYGTDQPMHAGAVDPIMGMGGPAFEPAPQEDDIPTMGGLESTSAASRMSGRQSSQQLLSPYGSGHTMNAWSEQQLQAQAQAQAQQGQPLPQSPIPRSNLLSPNATPLARPQQPVFNSFNPDDIGADEAITLAHLKLQQIRPQLGLLLAGFNDHTVKVAEIVEDGPASASGIQAGDILELLHTTKVKTVLDVQNVIHQVRPGMTVTVIIRRGNEVQEYNLTIGAQISLNDYLLLNNIVENNFNAMDALQLQEIDMNTNKAYPW